MPKWELWELKFSVIATRILQNKWTIFSEKFTITHHVTSDPKPAFFGATVKFSAIRNHG